MSKYTSQRKEYYRKNKKRIIKTALDTYYQNKESYIDKVRRYQRTFEGFIRSMHSGMRRRVGGNCRVPDLYKGKFVPDRADFLSLARSNKSLQRLHAVWKREGYVRSLTPTPHRKDSNLGYELHNIQFMTFGDNVREAHKLRKKKNKR